MSSWHSRFRSEGNESEHAESTEAADVDSPAAQLLELQRVSGNQAVQQLLSGEKRETNTPSEKTRDDSLGDLLESPERIGQAGVRIHTDDTAAKSADGLGAAAYTRGRDIYFGAGKYAPETSEGKQLLAHELTHALENEPGEESRRSANVSDVVAANDPSEHRANSVATSQGGATGFGSPSRAHPAAIHRAPLTEAEIAEKLHDAMSFWGTDEEAILNLLSSLNRDAAKIKKVRDAYTARYKTDLEDDLRAELSKNELSRALFLLNAPPPETPRATATVIKAGTEKHKAKVGDGEVTVNVDVEYKAGTAGPTYSGGFSTGYKGGKAEDTRWIQFLWSEVLATQTDGSVKHVAATSLPVAVGTMDLTTTSSSPKYKVDSGSSTSPFYESRFTGIRTSTGTTIYDRPSEFSSVINAQFDAGATKVVEVDHFEDFLIRENKAIYLVKINVTWTYTSKTAVTRATDFVSGSTISGMPAAEKKQLIKEYPKFDFIE